MSCVMLSDIVYRLGMANIKLWLSKAQGGVEFINQHLGPKPEERPAFISGWNNFTLTADFQVYQLSHKQVCFVKTVIFLKLLDYPKIKKLGIHMRIVFE